MDRNTSGPLFLLVEAVPTPAVSQRRSETQTTRWPPNSMNLKTRSIRLCTANESKCKGRLEHEQTGRNPNRSLNRRTTQAKTQERPTAVQETTQENPEQERTNRQGNPNRSPTQPQQLRPKTQKPRRACGKQSRRPSTNESERTSKATQTQAQLNHSSSGQRPKSHGEQAGDSPGRNEQEQKRTRVSSHRQERRR